jgi:undecaprenyl-diphosphatase
MPLYQIILLACIQGLAELLPVSSSAHVIVAEKLLGLDPSSPEMVLFLLMLHTGTMLAVLAYFWKDWKGAYFQSSFKGRAFVSQVLIATGATVILGFGLKHLIEKVVLKTTPNAEVEMLFGNTKLVAIALACTGFLILFASTRERKILPEKGLGPGESIWIGLIQGLCLPLRGFSRSGSTISTGILLRVSKTKSEDFSFAIGAAITPFVLLWEAHRLIKSQAFILLDHGRKMEFFYHSLLGMVFSFMAGLLALRWLSSWLNRGRWKWFGYYCLAFAALVWFLQSFLNPPLSP